MNKTPHAKRVKLMLGFMMLCSLMLLNNCRQEAFDTSPRTVYKKPIDLPNNVAVYVSYEAETMKVSQIENDNESFKGSENLNQLAKIPMIDRIQYETSIYKDGNFKTTINMIEPHQKIQSIVSLSPPNQDKELEPASKFEITQNMMTAYYKDGSIKFTQAVNLPTYKQLLEKMKQPCYKSNKNAHLSNVGIYNADASIYLSDCYKEELAKLRGTIKQTQDGSYTIIRKPLLDDEMKKFFKRDNHIKGTISSTPNKNKKAYKDLAKLQQDMQQLICKAIYDNSLKTTLTQRATLYLNEYARHKNKAIAKVHYGKVIYTHNHSLNNDRNIFLTSNEDPDAAKRKENIEKALEGNNPNNFDEVTIIDNENKKVVGKAIYEGEDKMIMSQRYKLKDNNDEVMVVNNEFYVTDPVTNTDRTDIIQTTYDNVNVQINLD